MSLAYLELMNIARIENHHDRELKIHRWHQSWVLESKSSCEITHEFHDHEIQYKKHSAVSLCSEAYNNVYFKKILVDHNNKIIEHVSRFELSFRYFRKEPVEGY